MTNELELAEAVRRACLEIALEAYEDAGIRGLCAEGRWESAIDAVRQAEAARLLPTPPPGTGPDPAE